MNKILSSFRRFATLEYAFFAILALQVIIPILHRFDLPLISLAPGQPKLDFQEKYDVAAVQRLFESYGPQGRTTYAWDLVADTFYPLLLGLSAILFTLRAIRNGRGQGLLILIPLLFMAADVLENMFFLLFLGTYPALSPTLVSTANVFTRIKLYTIPIVFLQLYVFVILTILVFILSKLRTLVPAITRTKEI